MLLSMFQRNTYSEPTLAVNPKPTGPLLDLGDEDPDKIFAGLPRTRHPRTGRDDTDSIRWGLIQSWPSLPYCKDQTHNRRKAYMAIVSLRTQSSRGWVRDEQVQKVSS